jgi:hypothetical protein
MHLCQIDVPGFDAARAFDSTRAFLLSRFPEILDVLPTARAATLVIGYRGADRVEAWAEALDEHRGTVGARGLTPERRPLWTMSGRFVG